MPDIMHTRVNPQTGKLERVAETGRVTADPYSGDLVAKCEQQRIGVARRVAGPLAEMRAGINKLDHEMDETYQRLAREEDAERAAGHAAFEPPWSKKAYWIVALVICGLEIGVNKYGLDALRANEISTWAMALLASLCIFWLGKVTARVVRQAPWRDKKWGGVGIAALGNIALLLVALHVAEARAFVAKQEAVAAGREAMGGMTLGFVALVLFGYLAMLGLSYVYTNENEAAEQRTARIARLRAALDGLWEARVKLARTYNRRLAEVNHDLESLLHDLAERVHQFRCGSMRGHPSVPAYFRQALPLTTVKPIHVGDMIDAQPRLISDVIAVADT